MSKPLPPHRVPVVADYEVLRCIGRGTYGEVWLVRSSLGTLRAAKVIYHDAFDSDRPYVREFMGIQEFEPVSTHESQMRIYHVGQNAQEFYFYYVMDLADDASLISRVESSELSQQPDVPAAAVTADQSYVLRTFLTSYFSPKCRRRGLGGLTGLMS